MYDAIVDFLITGVAGFISYKPCNQLPSAGNKVIALDGSKAQIEIQKQIKSL